MTTLLWAGRVPALACVVMAAVAAGCLEVETPLGPVEKAVADAKLVGEWKLSGEGSETLDVTVRNFNGREMYAEVREAGKETERYAVYLVDVGGAAFAHVRPLQDDGTLPGEFLLMRLDRVGDDKLNLRNFKKEFFDDKPHHTAESLRAIITENLNNAAMYEEGEMRLTRVKNAD